MEKEKKKTQTPVSLTVCCELGDETTNAMRVMIQGKDYLWNHTGLSEERLVLARIQYKGFAIFLIADRDVYTLIARKGEKAQTLHLWYRAGEFADFTMKDFAFWACKLLDRKNKLIA